MPVMSFLRHFTRWRDLNHPHLHLRELDLALVDHWVSQLREEVDAGLMKPRTFNRRLAAISSLYRWALIHLGRQRQVFRGTRSLAGPSSTLKRAPGR